MGQAKHVTACIAVIIAAAGVHAAEAQQHCGQSSGIRDLRCLAPDELELNKVCKEAGLPIDGRRFADVLADAYGARLSLIDLARSGKAAADFAQHVCSASTADRPTNGCFQDDGRTPDLSMNEKQRAYCMREHVVSLFQQTGLVGGVAQARSEQSDQPSCYGESIEGIDLCISGPIDDGFQLTIQNQQTDKCTDMARTQFNRAAYAFLAGLDDAHVIEMRCAEAAPSEDDNAGNWFTRAIRRGTWQVAENQSDFYDQNIEDGATFGLTVDGDANTTDIDVSAAIGRRYDVSYFADLIVPGDPTASQSRFTPYAYFAFDEKRFNDDGQTPNDIDERSISLGGLYSRRFRDSKQGIWGALRPITHSVDRVIPGSIFEDDERTGRITVLGEFITDHEFDAQIQRFETGLTPPISRALGFSTWRQLPFETVARTRLANRLWFKWEGLINAEYFNVIETFESDRPIVSAVSQLQDGDRWRAGGDVEARLAVRRANAFRGDPEWVTVSASYRHRGTVRGDAIDAALFTGKISSPIGRLHDGLKLDITYQDGSDLITLEETNQWKVGLSFKR